MKSLFAAALSLIILWHFAGSVKAEDLSPLTVSQAVEIAMEKNPALRSARTEVAANVYREEAAFLGFLPRFETGYDYAHYRNTPTFAVSGQQIPAGAQDQYAFFLGLRQPLFAGGSIYYNYKLAGLGVDVAKVSYAQAGLNLVLDVKTAYYNILRAQKKKTEGDQSVERLTAHLNDAKDFFSVGLIAKNEVLQSEVQLAQARQEAVRAGQALKMAVSQLNVLLQRGINEPLTLAEGLEYEPYPVTFDAAVKTAFEQRPEIKESRLAIEKSQKSVQLAEADYYPSVNLSLRYTREADSPDLKENPYGLTENTVALTSLTWTFWEWGKTKKLADESRTRVDQARYALQQVTDSVSLEVRQALLDLEEAEKNIGVAGVAVTQAEENYRIVTERYNVQMATSTDVLDAETLLTQADTNHSDALAQYNISKARVKRAMGEH
ncbi:MAG: TolC family protein [Pseudomonadota bacterium]